MAATVANPLAFLQQRFLLSANNQCTHCVFLPVLGDANFISLASEDFRFSKTFLMCYLLLDPSIDFCFPFQFWHWMSIVRHFAYV